MDRKSLEKLKKISKSLRKNLVWLKIIRKDSKRNLNVQNKANKNQKIFQLNQRESQSQKIPKKKSRNFQNPAMAVQSKRTIVQKDSKTFFLFFFHIIIHEINFTLENVMPNECQHEF